MLWLPFFLSFFLFPPPTLTGCTFALSPLLLRLYCFPSMIMYVAGTGDGLPLCTVLSSILFRIVLMLCLSQCRGHLFGKGMCSYTAYAIVPNPKHFAVKIEAR